MKKLLLFALPLLFSCHGRATDVDADAEAFIRTMYDTRQFEDTTFLTAHCTPALLARLRAAYDYEGAGYATWLFRSGMQDGPDEKHGVVSITQDGEWYTYEALDMGNTFSRSLHIVQQGQQFVIADVCGFESVDAATFRLVATRHDVVIVDVRTAAEFAEGHLDGALNIDIQQDNFREQAQQLLPAGKTLAIYCRSGRRSKTAAGTLSRMGFSGYELDGGYLAYMQSL